MSPSTSSPVFCMTFVASRVSVLCARGFVESSKKGTCLDTPELSASIIVDSSAAASGPGDGVLRGNGDSTTI